MEEERWGQIGCVLAAVVAAIIGLFLVRQCRSSQQAIQWEVKRELPEVRTGPAASLAPLNDYSFHRLPDGHYVTTDASGEARLRGELDSATCNIYLFQTSGLSKSACPKSNYTGGNTTCLEAGSAVYRTCSDHVIMTPSGEARVEGSSVWVTYLRGSRLTLLVVSEGRVKAWPVVDFDKRTLGDPVIVEAGGLWFSAPGQKPPFIQDLPGRKALPLDVLPRLMDELDLWTWVDRIVERAEEEKFPFPPFGVPVPVTEVPVARELILRAGGGSLEDERVQEAILHAVPWAEMIAKVFVEDVSVWTELHGESVDARKVGLDLDQARELLAEAGFPDGKGLPKIPLIFPEDDEQLAAMAEWVTGMLAEVGIPAVYTPLPPDYAQDKAEALIDSGQPVLWLGWQ